MKTFIGKTLLVIALVIGFMPSLVLSEEVKDNKEGKDLTLLVGGFSWHLGGNGYNKIKYSEQGRAYLERNDYNERNAFIGIRYGLLEAGVYNNSYEETSIVIGAHKQWDLLSQDNDFIIRVGLRGGVVTYDSVLPFAQPTAAIGYKNVTAELSWIPVITSEMNGVFTLNFGYTF